MRVRRGAAGARRGRRAAAAAVVAAVVGALVSTAAGAPPAGAAVPGGDAATVRLAGPVNPAAPHADAPVETITIPLTVTNTSSNTLYDVAISSLRGAPITTGASLDTALRGNALEEGDSTKRGPREPLPKPLAAHASVTVDYVVDTSNEDGTGVCLCFLGVYALDVLVTAADEQGGETATVARTQTYLPSLLNVPSSSRMGVGWLWPLLDRPHRAAPGTVFTDDDLAASVTAGGRLDRALQVVERVDAAARTDTALSRSVLLLLDPDLLDELVTMTGTYQVQAADGRTTAGTGGPAATAWLARLAAVLPRHEVRLTAPADPDVVGLAARGVPVQGTVDSATATRIATALRSAGGRLPAHDLAWPGGTDLDTAGLAALTAAGAGRVVARGDTDHDGSVAALPGTKPTPALVADARLSDLAVDAITIGKDNSPALQRLVVDAAMTSVEHPDDSRFVFVVPDRDVDVAPAAAVRAVLATASLGTPESPVSALAGAAGATVRPDLLGSDPGPAPAPLGTALDAAAAATRAGETVRSAVVSAAGAQIVLGDLAANVQRAASTSWVGQDAAAARSITALNERATALGNAVQVVVRTNGGSYSLASADAPLLLTVANNLPVAMRIRLDVTAVGGNNGFSARPAATVVIPAQGRLTPQVPTRVTRSGRFQVAVTVRTADGAAIGAPTTITVTSTAVGKVGQVVTYGAGALLVLALLLRGVRRLIARSRAGSGSPDDDPTPPDGRAEDRSTVPAKRS